MKYKGLFQYEPEATEHHCFVVRVYQTHLGKWFSTVSKDAIRIALFGPFDTKTEAINQAVYDNERKEPTVHSRKATPEDSHANGGRTGGESNRKRRRDSAVRQSDGAN